MENGLIHPRKSCGCRNLTKKVLNHHSSKWVFAETFLSSSHKVGGMTFRLQYKTPYYSLKVKTLLTLRTSQPLNYTTRKFIKIQDMFSLLK